MAVEGCSRVQQVLRSLMRLLDTNLCDCWGARCGPAGGQGAGVWGLRAGEEHRLGLLVWVGVFPGLEGSQEG